MKPLNLIGKHLKHELQKFNTHMITQLAYQLTNI